MNEITNNTENRNGTINITIVYDNNSFVEGLQTDWGFACFIDTDKNKILFDTGDNGDILLSNMKKLDIDPKIIDTVFLSHFHHDHTGGLKDFLKLNSNVTVYFPQSFPTELIVVINESGAKSIHLSSFSEILPDVFSTGEIQAVIPEQSLVIRRTNELIIITGCAHPGITNILQLVKEKFPEELIHLALGGFHLHRLDEKEINEVIQNISGMNIFKIAPTHCTGGSARDMFNKFFNDDYIETGAGKVITIN